MMSGNAVYRKRGRAVTVDGSSMRARIAIEYAVGTAGSLTFTEP